MLVSVGYKKTDSHPSATKINRNTRRSENDLASEIYVGLGDKLYMYLLLPLKTIYIPTSVFSCLYSGPRVGLLFQLCVRIVFHYKFFFCYQLLCF